MGSAAHHGADDRVFRARADARSRRSCTADGGTVGGCPEIIRQVVGRAGCRSAKDYSSGWGPAPRCSSQAAAGEQLVEVLAFSARDCVITETLSHVVLAPYMDAAGQTWCHCSGARGLYWWLWGTQHTQWRPPEGVTASPGR